jgi:hypothetical protein
LIADSNSKFGDFCKKMLKCFVKKLDLKSISGMLIIKNKNIFSDRIELIQALNVKSISPIRCLLANYKANSYLQIAKKKPLQLIYPSVFQVRLSLFSLGSSSCTSNKDNLRELQMSCKDRKSNCLLIVLK